MKAVIMCGGAGTRLWPISRQSTPKQFNKIFNDKSLFELTLERNSDLCDGFIVIVNEKQLSLCKEQVPANLKDIVQFIVEPVGRNTAPAIALAAHLTKNDDLLILASDHLISELDIYKNCVESAQKIGGKDNLVTFGITAKYPETGYGYIEADGNQVLSFKEKPDTKTAIEYVASGNYFWNSGMFYFNAEAFLTELNNYAVNIYEKSLKALECSKKEEKTIYIQKEHMFDIPANSIDYAVMENSKKVKVIPSPFYWSDLGSFDSLYSELPKDEDGNSENKNYVQLNSHNNLVISPKKLVATFDVNDIIIINTEDALLIGKRGETQKVKQVLEKVKSIDPDLLN